MPSHSKKQHNFMEAIAHSPSFAKKVHIPQSVGKDFAAADKGKTFSKGGNMKRMAFGGETASDKKAKDRLANMREEDAEVAEGRQKQQREERLASFGRSIAMDDLRAAQKQGKTYDKWFEDNRKNQLKKGQLSKEMYDAGRGIEMMTPSQHRETLTSSGMKKGGEVKESKAMVGKEVAFMKKKGAPKSMLKHEETEMMKRGGKVRRMAAGGTGDPFELSNEDLANYEKNGAKNLKSLKNFFGFGEKEPAPIDRSRDVVSKPNAEATYTPRPPLGITKPNNQSPRTSSGNSAAEDAVEREDAAARVSRTALDEADKQKKNAMDAFNPALAEAQMQAQRAKDAFKPKPRKPVGLETTERKQRVITAPTDNSYDAVERNRAAKTTSTSLARLRKESEDKIRDSKPGSMTKQMREAPTIDELYRGQKSMGEEIGDLLKSFRSSIRGGLKSGEDKRKLREEEMHVAKGGRINAYAKGGNVKETMGPRNMSQDVVRGSNKAAAHGEHGLQERGKTRAMMPKMKGSSIGDVPAFAKGGMVGRASARGDGIASKGRTRGKLC